MDWNLVAFVIRSELKQICLEELEKPKMPSKIAKKHDKELNSITRALTALREEDLVECLTPDHQSYRIYGLTDKGKEILKKIKEMEE